MQPRVLHYKTSLIIKLNIMSILIFVDDPIKRPIPSESNMWTRKRKKEWLELQIESFLSEHLSRANEVPEKIVQLDNLHREGFTCRSDDCEMSFPLHSRRVR